MRKNDYVDIGIIDVFFTQFIQKPVISHQKFVIILAGFTHPKQIVAIFFKFRIRLVNLFLDMTHILFARKFSVIKFSNSGVNGKFVIRFTNRLHINLSAVDSTFQRRADEDNVFDRRRSEL